MTFADIDQRYRELKQQFESGLLNEREFDEALRELMIQDEQGRWWAKARDTGQWNYYDTVTQNWVPASPPTQRPATSPASMPLQSADPASVTPTYTESGVYQPQAAQSSAHGFGPADFRVSQPELSPGLKAIFYILSFLVPIVGLVLYFVYRSKPTQEDRSAATLFLVLDLVSFALSCLCIFMITLMAASFSY